MPKKKKSIFILSLFLSSCVMMNIKTEDKQFSEANVEGNSFSLNNFSVKKKGVSSDITANNPFSFNDRSTCNILFPKEARNLPTL